MFLKNNIMQILVKQVGNITLFLPIFLLALLCECNKKPLLLQKKNILFISIDTVRADHLGTHGYWKNTSPLIDSLAEQGICYDHAISQAPWTLPSMVSAFTSLYPSEHGSVEAKIRMPKKQKTITEKLKKAGYHTIGICSHSFVSSQYGFERGFSIFDESQIKGHDAVTSDSLTLNAIHYLSKMKTDKPFFLWIHYFDPHFSYIRHPEFKMAEKYQAEIPDTIVSHLLYTAEKNKNYFNKKDLNFIESVYDEEIAYTDHWIKRLLTQMQNMGKLNSTIIILFADHGEYFQERGKFFHGKDVYEPLIHVPLVISGDIDKEMKGKRVSQPVEISSIPKTIMGILGSTETYFQGHDLYALAHQEERDHFPVFSEGNYAWGTDQRKKAIIQSDWKLIYNFDDDSYEFYNIKTDPDENQNLLPINQPEIETIYRQLTTKLGSYPAQIAESPQEVQLDKKTMERLKSLGYIN